MNSIRFFLIFLAALLAGLSGASAQAPADKAPAELIAKGRDLFNNKEGLQVKYACILCHKQNKAVKAAAVQKAGDKLPAVINKYIVKKSKGKPLAENSEEMKALMAYIRHEHMK